MNDYADAQIISTLADGVVLVARSGETDSADLAESLDSVKRSGGNVCGVALNFIKPDRSPFLDLKNFKISLR